jgi:hypothetical protein
MRGRMTDGEGVRDMMTGREVWTTITEGNRAGI